MRDWKFHCAVLGVREDASAKDIRRAYRRLALERHPDKHNNSNQAKEEFQQLNESYRFLMSASAGGRRASAPPPHANSRPPSPGPERPRATPNDFMAPAMRRNSTPARVGPAASNGGYRRLWLHGAIACAVLSVLSVLAELGGGTKRPARPAQRDLFLKSWCQIKSSPGANEKPEVFEYWPEQACQDRCLDIAKGADATCSWNGVEFRTARSVAPSPPAKTAGEELVGKAPPPPEDVTCEISLERSAGVVTTSPPRKTSEKTCLVLCRDRADTFPHAGVRCSWAGNPIFQQPLYQVQHDPEPPELPQTPPPVMVSAKEYSSICFMTIVVPGAASAVPYPNETRDSCIDRCAREITAHPLDREVSCAFGGRVVSKHVPDPLASYLASRDPAEEGNEVRMGNSSMAVCEIYGTAGGSRILAFTAAKTDIECQSSCRYEADRVSKPMELTCKYAGKEYFRKVFP